MVAGRAPGGLLGGDDVLEDGGDPVDDVGGEGAGEDDDARAVGQGVGELGTQRVGGLRDVEERTDRGRLVDEDALLDPVGVREGGEVGGLGEDGEQVLEPAVLAAAEAGGAGGGAGRVLVVLTAAPSVGGVVLVLAPASAGRGGGGRA